MSEPSTYTHMATNAWTSRCFDQLILQLSDIRQKATAACLKIPVDESSKSSADFLNDINDVVHRLETMKKVSVLAIDKNVTVFELQALARAFGYDFDFQFRPKDVEAPNGTRLNPHPHGPISSEQTSTGKVS